MSIPRRKRDGGGNMDDIIIVVMGQTGVGKSTFINTAAGKVLAGVGHGLLSSTAAVEPITVPYPSESSGKIIFVDTPGFDDTYIDDSRILKRIADWLAKSYEDGKKITGIVYMYDISRTRMSGEARKNLTMFGKLCGDNAARNVILTTTKWNHVTEAEGGRRERQLSDTYWKSMRDEGSQVARFSNTYESSWEIVNRLLEIDTADSLLIQEELVNLRKRFPETEAAKALRLALQELADKLKEKVDDEGRREELMKQLRSVLNQIQELKVPLGRRLTTFFATKKARAHAVNI